MILMAIAATEAVRVVIEVVVAATEAPAEAVVVFLAVAVG